MTMLSLYAHYREGRLLNDGAIGMQPAGYVDVMTILDAAFKKKEAELMKTPNGGTSGTSRTPTHSRKR